MVFFSRGRNQFSQIGMGYCTIQLSPRLSVEFRPSSSSSFKSLNEEKEVTHLETSPTRFERDALLPSPHERFRCKMNTPRDGKARRLKPGLMASYGAVSTPHHHLPFYRDPCTPETSLQVCSTPTLQQLSASRAPSKDATTNSTLAYLHTT